MAALCTHHGMSAFRHGFLICHSLSGVSVNFPHLKPTARSPYPKMEGTGTGDLLATGHVELRDVKSAAEPPLTPVSTGSIAPYPSSPTPQRSVTLSCHRVCTPLVFCGAFFRRETHEKGLITAVVLVGVPRWLSLV